MKGFAGKHQVTYSNTDRQLHAYFEIGCFLSIITFYERTSFTAELMNLDSHGSFRYLTTPAGNPDNFSWVALRGKRGAADVRQQVRIESTTHRDIAFTPDIVVLRAGSGINQRKDKDYAGGTRGFFSVRASQVIAAHECKSLDPFPELLVSFLGFFGTAHSWSHKRNVRRVLNDRGPHLAPGLFVGGSESGLHRRMIEALKSRYPINIITSLHAGTWNLLGPGAEVNRMNDPNSVFKKKVKKKTKPTKKRPARRKK